MEKYGFVGLPTEWWHFDYKSRELCEVLDISFERISCQKNKFKTVFKQGGLWETMAPSFFMPQKIKKIFF